MRKVDDVVELFRSQLEKGDEPDLALLSVVTGYIENLMTCHRSVAAPVENIADDASAKQAAFPVVEYGPIEALHAKFACQVKGSVDASLIETAGVSGTRELIKRVSDVVWSSLTRSYYKDRPHLQSLYSYLTGEWLLFLFLQLLRRALFCRAISILYLHHITAGDAFSLSGSAEKPLTFSESDSRGGGV